MRVGVRAGCRGAARTKFGKKGYPTRQGGEVHNAKNKSCRIAMARLAYIAV